VRPNRRSIASSNEREWFMLIAPFSLSPSEHSRYQRSSMSSVQAVRPPIGTLIAWLIFGCGVLLCVPATRGGPRLGATLPFWLVVAPMLNLAWLERRSLARRAAGFLRRRAREKRMARSVRAQRLPGSVACSVARS
jgi:hypothetical protein